MPAADVYQGQNLVAHFERTLAGIRLTFTEGVSLENGFLATTLKAEDVESSDLPPFFLNLLPEGAKLQLLLEASQNRDDSLGLLLKAGWDTIGNVTVLPHGEPPRKHEAMVKTNLESKVSFWDLFYAGASDQPDNSIPGVQEKISASTVTFGVRARSVPSAILKLNPTKFPRVVYNEEFFLRMARDCGIQTNKATLIYDKHNEPGLLVSRFDRAKDGRSIKKLHQEDGCQLLNSVPGNKYDLPMRSIADAVTKVCTSGKVEVERLLRQIAFSYIIGNGDLHAKNISVLWDGVVRLSPAYDLLSTLPYNLDQKMALKIQGKDDKLRKGVFIDFGRIYGLHERAVEKMLSDLCQRAGPWIGKLNEIGFDPSITAKMEREITARLERIRV